MTDPLKPSDMPETIYAVNVLTNGTCIELVEFSHRFATRYTRADLVEQAAMVVDDEVREAIEKINKVIEWFNLHIKHRASVPHKRTCNNMPIESVKIINNLVDCGGAYCCKCASHRCEHVRAATAAKSCDKLVQALEELIDLQKVSLAVDVRSKGIFAPEDAEVKALCEKVGYGAVMDSAARQWHLKDPGAGHTTYHCYNVVKSATRNAKKALAEHRATEGK